MNKEVTFSEVDYKFLCEYVKYKLQHHTLEKISIPEYDSKKNILNIQYKVYVLIEEKYNLKRRIGPLTTIKRDNRLTNLDSTQIKNGYKIMFYRGETLNTPLYLLKLLLNQDGKYMKTLNKYYIKNKLKGYLKLKGYKPGSFSKRALNYFPTKLEDYSDEDFEENYGVNKVEYVNNIKLVNEFCRLYSSVGNMIVLIDDKKANTNKSGNFADHDTGTQMLIQVDYYFKNKEIKGPFLSDVNTKEWVDSYRNFKNFIHAFALEDYVDENYNVKVMFKGQSIHNLKPQTANEAQQSLTHLIDVIKKREERMLNYLKNNNDNEFISDTSCFKNLQK